MLTHLIGAIGCVFAIGVSSVGVSKNAPRSNEYRTNILDYTLNYNLELDSTLVDSVGESYTCLIPISYDYSNATMVFNPYTPPYSNFGYQPSVESNYTSMLSAVNRLTGYDMMIYFAITYVGTAHSEYRVFTSYVFGYQWNGYFTTYDENDFCGNSFVDNDSQWNELFRDSRSLFYGSYDVNHQYNFSTCYFMGTYSDTPEDTLYLTWNLNYHVDAVTNQDYINGYNSGYHDGYNNGYSDGMNDESTLNDEYQRGYTIGYNQGINDATPLQVSFLGVLGAIADTPVLIIRNLFSFEFFGISALAVFMTLLTALIVIYFVRKVL